MNRDVSGVGTVFYVVNQSWNWVSGTFPETAWWSHVTRQATQDTYPISGFPPWTAWRQRMNRQAARTQLLCLWLFWKILGYLWYGREFFMHECEFWCLWSIVHIMVMLEGMTFDLKLGVRVYIGGWKQLCMLEIRGLSTVWWSGINIWLIRICCHVRACEIVYHGLGWWSFWVFAMIVWKGELCRINCMYDRD